MKKTLTIIIIVLGFAMSPHNLSAQSFGWAKEFTGNINSQGSETTTDLSGNIISAGTFSGTVDFDPGPGTFNMNGFGDIYVSKLDAVGNFIWAKCFLEVLTKDVTSIKTDGAGNVYIAGHFSGVIDFDPGPAVYNLTGNNFDIFICKLDAAGNFVWAVRMGGSNENICWSLAIDTWGNVITTGVFSGTADFDPGPGTFNLTAPINSQVAFVSKLDNSGSFIWAKSFITSSVITSAIIGSDIMGNIYTSGWFHQTVDFDPGPATVNLTSSGGRDIFLSKLDTAGNFVWAKQMSGIVDEESTDMYVDPIGFIYMTGIFKGITDFDPGAGIYNLTASGNSSGFVAKYDPYGNMFWAKQLSGDIIVEAYAITMDPFSNVIIGGRFLGIADFNPDTTYYYINSNSYFNGFICTLSASGNFKWAHNLASTSGYSQVNCISSDQSGNLFLTGRFNGSCDFDPGSGTFYMAYFTSYNAYLLKLDYCNVSTSILNEVGCMSYLSPSGNFTWTSSGVYNDIITSASGCDSVLTINLTINTVDTSVTVVDPTLTANAANASYQWINCALGIIPGATSQNYTATSNGNYAVIVTQNGCTDTSQCIPVTSVSLSEHQQVNEISFYPNPVQDRLFINWGIKLPDVQIIVLDFTGRTLISMYIGISSKTEIELPYSPGFYQVQVVSGANYQAAFKIVKR